MTLGTVPSLTDLELVDPTSISQSLDRCLAVYRRWLYLPDDDQPIAALGAVAANLIPGDPLWMLYVGSPGSGKTETVAPLDALPYVHAAASFTEAALLSGTPRRKSRREHEAGCSGSLVSSASSSPRTSQAYCR